MVHSLDGIAFGGDYNPEQWPEATWREDVRLMRAAGVNLVTVGVFAWSRIQPDPTTWDFDWLDRVLDLLAQYEVAVDLATATASPPPWFSARHPDSLPVDRDGTRLAIGSRQHFCPSSEAFAEAAVELVERMAERYATHPALAMWHIGNEYGDHVEQCYCDRSAAHFRAWLTDRYGTVEALNATWNTDVWSGRYSDWAEVMPPRKAPGPMRPSLALDYRRFSSDALLGCFERERDILRRVSPDIPVTTNFMRPSPAIDQWRWAAAEDVVSCDIYPDPLDPLADMDAAFTHDLMRSLGEGRPWLVMEQAPSSVDWRPVNLPERVEVVRRRSLGAVAAGADGICFFQWRASRSGPEMLHSSLLPPGGETSPGWAATVRLGHDLRRLAEVAGSRCAPADVAILLEWEAWWALEQEGHPSDRLRLRDLALAMYTPLRSAGLAVDVRHPEHDLRPYRLVLAPNLFLMSPQAVRSLTTFVEHGGTALVGPFSGIVLPSYERADGAHPSLLRDLLGLRVEEWWPVPDGHVGCRFEDGSRCRAKVWREALVPTGAEVVARFEDGTLAGWPVVTRNRIGDGRAWYLGTVLDSPGMARLVDLASAEAGVSGQTGVPEGVDLRRRVGAGGSYLFVANRTDDTVDVAVDDTEALDLLTGAPVRGVVRLGPQGVAVLRSSGAGPA